MITNRTTVKAPLINFIIKPNEVTRVDEGSTAVLRCKIEKQTKHRFWMLNDISLFKDDDFMVPEQSQPTANRTKFIGNFSNGDYSVEIEEVRLKDQGHYRCVAYPDDLKDLASAVGLDTGTYLKVIPRPPPDEPTTDQSHSHYMPSSQQAAASLENSGSYESSSVPSSRLQFNNNKAREAFPGARELDRNNQITSSGLGFISPSSSPYMNNYNSQHHATVRASTAFPATTTNSYGLTSAALVWPYLLLALAALLMIANIYLIFSLIRRHTRSKISSQTRDSLQSLE